MIQPTRITISSAIARMLRFSVSTTKCGRDRRCVIDSNRNALGGDELIEEEQVASGIFLITKDGSVHSAVGIVDGRDQRKAGTTPFQPIMPAAIDLQQHAVLGIAIPPLMVSGCSTRAWAGYPAFHQQAAYC